MVVGTKDTDPDRGLPPKEIVSRAMLKISSGVMPETGRVPCFMPPAAISMTASSSRGRSRRPTPAARRRCRTTTCVLSDCWDGQVAVQVYSSPMQWSHVSVAPLWTGSRSVRAICRLVTWRQSSLHDKMVLH